jgi:hypothetical protein
VINSIKSKEKRYHVLAKPEKLFMQNTNISYAITASIDTESAREAFFVNQIKNSLNAQTRLVDDRIFGAKKGDFLVDNTYAFEVGHGAKIPLWLFGFLY